MSDKQTSPAYKIVHFELDSWEDRKKDEVTLNDLGKIGWEAVNFDYVPNTDVYVLLKRLLAD